MVDVKFEADADDGKWVCPVSRKELGAGVRAVYLVPCGHAFLESAVREVAGESGLCLKVCLLSFLFLDRPPNPPLPPVVLAFC